MRAMERPLEQLAQTTEPQMVQRRFDEQNLVWAYLISWFFALSSFILVASRVRVEAAALRAQSVAVMRCVAHVLHHRRDERNAARAAARQRPLRAYARIVRRNLAAWLVAVFIVKFATLIYFALTTTPAGSPGASIFPTRDARVASALPAADRCSTR